MKLFSAKKERDAAFLNGSDISTCQRCGDYRVWHIYGKGEDEYRVTGIVCTRCFWTCGDANILTAISCLFMEWRIKLRDRRFQRAIRKSREKLKKKNKDICKEVPEETKEKGRRERVNK